MMVYEYVIVGNVWW